MKPLTLKIPVRRSKSPLHAGTYFAIEGAPLLLEAGWTLVARLGTGGYYLRPPSLPPNPVVTIQVPDETEIEALRYRLHASRQSYAGEFHGWPVKYEPSEVKTVRIQGRAKRFRTRARLEMGAADRCWHVTFIWTRGDEKPPKRVEYRRNRVPMP